jgi:hypothetical protein
MGSLIRPGPQPELEFYEAEQAYLPLANPLLKSSGQ